MNVPVGDGKIGIEEPLSKAGDFVDLRAETDLLVAISNCPQERNPLQRLHPHAASHRRVRPAARVTLRSPAGRARVGSLA